VRLSRRYALAAAVIPLLAAAVTTGVIGNEPTAKILTSGRPLREQVGTGNTWAMPPGAMKAGRWLRDHSDPRDVVATNSHCRRGSRGCDSRDFWVAAYSERQVVVEGWSYTEAAFETGGLWDLTLARSPFWDPQLLAANDDVFYRPTAENVAAFTRQHGVRWLVAVRGVPTPARGANVPSAEPDPNLGSFAVERYRAGDVVVYETRP
jgi:hypothetical protein